MDPLRPGDPARVGDYVLSARLGAGGMGEVFFGRSPAGRPVAVKLVHPVYAADGEFRRRFKLEVAAARRVGGFHTAPVVAADPDAERPWMVTAYVAGPSLAEALAKHGPLPAATLRRLGAGLAEALQAIHKEGLIHRDLKPSNILLAADGPRVIDFGIARAVDGSGATALAGTPGFMSPEVLTGRALTPACDVFALGLILAHAAGVRPFGEGPADAVNYRIVHQDPDLTGLDRDLAALVHRCLAKDPAGRPAPAALIGVLSDGGDTHAWLPGDIQTMVTRHHVPTAPALPQNTFDGAIYHTTAWKGALKDIVLGLCSAALAALCSFPGVIHGYFHPNSFSPHPQWVGLVASAFLGLGACACLHSLVQAKDYRRRLEITASGLDVTIGEKHHSYRWDKISKISVMTHRDQYLRHAYIYACPTSDVAPTLEPPKFPPRKTDPARGWIRVCPIDDFGTHQQVIMKALARYAGPVWEPPPPEGPLEALSADTPPRD
jgi:serine/threonine protein kinase